MRPRLLTLAFSAVIALVAGCGVVTISERGDMTERMRTLSVQQAWARVDQHIADAVAALPVTPRLEEIPPNLTLSCDDPSDQGPLGRVSVAKVYWMRELPTERTTEVFNTMHLYWLSHDYRVLTDKRDRPGVPALFVEHNTDAFRMSLKTSVQGELSISATSPCVWPQGTPPPDVVRH